MKKLIKGLLAVVGCVILILVLALALHPLWIGSAVKFGAEKVGPTFTGTPIALANCDINLYAGRVAFDGFALDNPVEASEKVAASVGAFKVVVDPSTVASDVIVIRELTIKDIFASYINVNGTNNFDIIAANAAGEKKAEEKSAPEEETAEEDKPAKKVIIEKLTLSGIKLVIGVVPVTVPVDITLTDIGKAKGGATLDEVWEQISEAVMKVSTALGDALKSLGDVGAKAVGDAAEALKDVGANANEALKAIGSGSADSLKDAGKATKEALKDATKSLKNIGGDAADSIKDIGKGLKGLF